jgi:methionine synthase II (cobalamin-independent)
MPGRTFQCRQAQPEPPDLRDHARTRQQRDTAAGMSEDATDIAADAAGARHDNRPILTHLCSGKFKQIADVAALLPDITKLVAL